MEIAIRKPSTTVKVDKRELQLEKMYQRKMKQATIYGPPSASVPVPVNHVRGIKFYIGCSYAVMFTLWFLDVYISL